MTAKTLLIGLAAAALAVPAIAQAYDPGSAQPAPASPNPGTTAANATVQQAVDAREAIAAGGQAQYEADRQAYLDALVQHDRAVNRADARYVRQQRAYADAMAVWRWQVQKCKQGSQRACDLPSPNPADFY
jgi:hypothetical protein